jgi:hypothetical protein
MDWSSTIDTLMHGVITLGVVAGTGLIYRYTGYQATAAQQTMITDKATQLAHQAIAAAQPGIEQAVIHVTDNIVQQKVPQMVSDLAQHGITVTAGQAADKIQAALGAAQVAAPTVAVDVPKKVI